MAGMYVYVYLCTYVVHSFAYYTHVALGASSLSIAVSPRVPEDQDTTGAYSRDG